MDDKLTTFFFALLSLT